MKMTVNMVLVVSFVWFGFLILTSISALRVPLVYHIALGIISACVMIGLLYRWVIKPIDVCLHEINEDLQNEISERVSLEQKLMESYNDRVVPSIHHDNLTSLPNRIFFNETLNKAISHSKRYAKNLAVLILNIDKFTKINTSFGFTLGDQVIHEISKRIVKVLRSEDVVARLDGDEFIILLNDSKQDKFVSVVADKILTACAEKIYIDAHLVSLTVSVGISIYPQHGCSLESLLGHADAALKKVKQEGGKAHRFFTQELEGEKNSNLRTGTGG